MRRRLEAWARRLHDTTDETGFVHNCIAHPLWWLFSGGG